MNHGDGGFGPGGGSGREAEGEFDVVAEGQHVGAGWAGAEPSFFGDQQTRADAPGHRVAAGFQGSGHFKILADGPEGSGQRPGNRFGNFLKFSSRVDQEGGDRTGGVFGGRGQQGFQIFWCEHGVIVDNQQMGEVGKFFEGELTGGGEAAAKTEIFAGGDELAREGGFFDGLDGGGVGAVVADHDREGADGLAVKGFEQAGEEVGAEAGRHEGDDARRVSHESRMDDSPGDGRSKMGDGALRRA